MSTLEERLAQQRARNAASKEWCAFLETTPAYVERTFSNLLWDTNPSGTKVLGIFAPRIQLYCEKDDGFRGFDPKESRIFCAEPRTTAVEYTCRDCGAWRKTFALILVPTKDETVLTAMKLGEYPPFGSHIAKRLQNLLTDDDLMLYRKGLRSEREGQGIGAAAYFRRVVENQWRALVEKLRDAAKRLVS